MPRYYFNIKDGDGFYPNPQGVDLADIRMAHEHALKLAQELMTATGREAEDWTHWRVEIEDESRERVLTVPFVEASEAMG